MPTRIPFLAVPNEVLSACPPDGRYALVSYSGGFEATQFGLIRKPFPWGTSIYLFKGGRCELYANGSGPAHMLAEYDVDRVYLVELDEGRRRELDRMLAEKEIELIPAEAAEKASQDARA